MHVHNIRLSRLPRVEADEKVVPEAYVVANTGTAIVNLATDHFLELSKNAREVDVMGPTARMIPDPEFRGGVAVMGGVSHKCPEAASDNMRKGRAPIQSWMQTNSHENKALVRLA